MPLLCTNDFERDSLQIIPVSFQLKNRVLTTVLFKNRNRAMIVTLLRSLTPAILDHMLAYWITSGPYVPAAYAHSPSLRSVDCRSVCFHSGTINTIAPTANYPALQVQFHMGTCPREVDLLSPLEPWIYWFPPFKNGTYHEKKTRRTAWGTASAKSPHQPILSPCQPIHHIGYSPVWCFLQCLMSYIFFPQHWM